MDNAAWIGLGITLAGAALIGISRLLVGLVTQRVPKLESSVERAHERINDLKDDRKAQR